MEQRDLETFADWFDAFCRAHYEADEDGQRSIRLKEVHTHRVRENAVRIARELGLSENDALLAECAALLHDVGRFPQFREFRTFRDGESTNHAALGARILIENAVLAPLTRKEQDLVLKAVTLHNVFDIPGGLDRETLLHVRIVRDADKLDIWRIFAEYFSLPASERPSAAGLGLPESPGYTPAILTNLEHRQLVRLTQLATLDDFKLLQLAWVYDLNFLPSLRMADKRGIIDALSATLPADDRVARAVDSVRAYVRETLACGKKANVDL